MAVTTDLKEVEGHPTLSVSLKYVDPVLTVAGCAPVLLPSLGSPDVLDCWLAGIDGLVFTGSPSNIEPHHYGESLLDPESLSDRARDTTTLPLIPRAIALGVPIFAICRGFQEINVALGGTLHQAVHEQPGLMDHRDDPNAPLDVQYALAHEVQAVPGGWLATLLGRTRWQVNSLHGQGVKRLAPDLQPEAYAPDGLLEAYTHRTAPGFLLAAQWHPEWRAAHDPVSAVLFQAFGAACRDYRRRRVAADVAPVAADAH